ncbi:5,6-dimethylbenzimidazole synthase [Rhodococcus marinonascens]|uniref:5,6-dimethylbenzimidazole synthase n=1 Tax=Rhodococcus marinonascens TaxID=38311 RepID=UPI000932F01E|nr:5,6-dimethylbenzimidazole synthase [Rhodococcus marinonascens]
MTESAGSAESNVEPGLSVYDAIRRRRDVRAEFTGMPIAADVLERVLGAGHCAPSVGNTQPWDFVVVRDPRTLDRFADHVADARLRFARSLPDERRQTFDPIKIEGIRESGMGVVVTYDRSRGGEHILGRHTVDDTGLFSAVLAIQNLWLAATAESVGVGWVSFYDESYLTELLGIPEPVRPIAWLCVGDVAEFQQVPDLERLGWRGRRPLADAVHLEKF